MLQPARLGRDDLFQPLFNHNGGLLGRHLLIRSCLDLLALHNFGIFLDRRALMRDVRVLADVLKHPARATVDRRQLELPLEAKTEDLAARILLRCRRLLLLVAERRERVRERVTLLVGALR